MRTVIVAASLVLAASVSAQPFRTVDCPTVYDSTGARVGLVQGTGGHGSRALSTALYRETARSTQVQVALEASGTTFVVHVGNDCFDGTVPPELLRSRPPIYFSTPDCTGPAYYHGPEYPSSYAREASGPLPLTLVGGPAQTVWLFDPSATPTSFTVASSWEAHSQDGCDQACQVYPVPFSSTAYLLTPLGDLSAQFTPPYTVQAGPCPRPGPGRP